MGARNDAETRGGFGFGFAFFWGMFVGALLASPVILVLAVILRALGL